jgi:hypothetical protein
MRMLPDREALGIILDGCKMCTRFVVLRCLYISLRTSVGMWDTPSAVVRNK